MALEMCDGSEQVLQTVLDVFDRSVAQQHEALRLAAQTGRLADVAAEAHKLAGAAAGIGATEMLQWARTLGTLCKGGLGESVVEHVKGFPALLERFQVARDHSGAAAESADASRSGQTDGAAMPESALDGSGVGPDER
jgi:HPt (histidine-containing phosphotransfer) domain-containing protein